MGLATKRQRIPGEDISRAVEVTHPDRQGRGSGPAASLPDSPVATSPMPRPRAAALLGCGHGGGAASGLAASARAVPYRLDAIARPVLWAQS